MTAATAGPDPSHGNDNLAVVGAAASCYMSAARDRGTAAAPSLHRRPSRFARPTGPTTALDVATLARRGRPTLVSKDRDVERIDCDVAFSRRAG